MTLEQVRPKRAEVVQSHGGSMGQVLPTSEVVVKPNSAHPTPEVLNAAKDPRNLELIRQRRHSHNSYKTSDA
jgi:hypothetical protein